MANELPSHGTLTAISFDHAFVSHLLRIVQYFFLSVFRFYRERVDHVAYPFEVIYMLFTLPYPKTEE